MDEHYYLYCFTWAGSSLERLAEGVDRRFPVETLDWQRVSAIASRVGLDQFDLPKLQKDTTDVRWLSELAVRHHQVICRVVSCSTVLPLRLGTLFQSRSSLMARVSEFEPTVADFLQKVGNRHEWAVKVYLNEHQREPRTQSPVHPQPPDGAGMAYFAQKRLAQQRRQQTRAMLREELLALEAALCPHADNWRLLKPLPAILTGRREPMVWNAAFLVSEASQPLFGRTCEHLSGTLVPKGLILETTGPWPAYHFCPTLDCGEAPRNPRLGACGRGSTLRPI